jgi:hypothetical protein
MRPAFADQGVAVSALQVLAARFPFLPAAAFCTNAIYLGRLEVALHDDPGDFEAWRQALAFPASGVELRHHKGLSWLEVFGSWGGTEVRLLGYGLPPVEPRPEPTPGRLAEQHHQFAEDPAVEAGFAALAAAHPERCTPAGGGR